MSEYKIGEVCFTCYNENCKKYSECPVGFSLNCGNEPVFLKVEYGELICLNYELNKEVQHG